MFLIGDYVTWNKNYKLNDELYRYGNKFKIVDFYYYDGISKYLIDANIPEGIIYMVEYDHECDKETIKYRKVLYPTTYNQIMVHERNLETWNP